MNVFWNSCLTHLKGSVIHEVTMNQINTLVKPKLMCTVHHNTKHLLRFFNTHISTLLICRQQQLIFNATTNFFTSFSHKQWEGRKWVQKSLSWSYEVAVKVAIITCFSQAASSCPDKKGRDCELRMTSPYEVVSSLRWRQASVFTAGIGIDRQHTVTASLAVSQLVTFS